jgi:hypothetical protein
MSSDVQFIEPEDGDAIVGILRVLSDAGYTRQSDPDCSATTDITSERLDELIEVVRDRTRAAR